MKKISCLFGVALSLLLIFLFCGCGTTAYVQKDDTIDFSKIKTYAWVENNREDSSKPKPAYHDLTDRKIRQSLDRNLVANGWKQDKQHPDVWLVTDMTTQKENRNISNPVYSYPATRWYYNPYAGRFLPIYYPSRFLGYESSRETYLEGTLTLTVVDAASNKTIWQGWVSSDLNGKHLTDGEIDNHVKAIVRKLG